MEVQSVHNIVEFDADALIARKAENRDITRQTHKRDTVFWMGKIPQKKMAGIFVDQICWEFESTSLPKYVESNCFEANRIKESKVDSSGKQY